MTLVDFNNIYTNVIPRVILKMLHEVIHSKTLQNNKNGIPENSCHKQENKTETKINTKVTHLTSSIVIIRLKYMVKLHQLIIRQRLPKWMKTTIY